MRFIVIRAAGRSAKNVTKTNEMKWEWEEASRLVSAMKW